MCMSLYATTGDMKVPGQVTRQSENLVSVTGFLYSVCVSGHADTHMVYMCLHTCQDDMLSLVTGWTCGYGAAAI